MSINYDRILLKIEGKPFQLDKPSHEINSLLNFLEISKQDGFTHFDTIRMTPFKFVLETDEQYTTRIHRQETFEKNMSLAKQDSKPPSENPEEVDIPYHRTKPKKVLKRRF